MADAPKRIVKDPEVRKAEIIEAAAGLFRIKGFLATSIQEIVKSAGISHGAFFYYFPTKQDVLIALGKTRLTAFQKTLREWIADESMSPKEKILKVLQQVDSLRNMRVAVDFVGFGFIRQDPEVHNTLVNLAVPMLMEDVEALLQQGIDCGDFRIPNKRGIGLCLILLSADLIHRADVTEQVVKWPDLYGAYVHSVAAMLGFQNDPVIP